MYNRENAAGQVKTPQAVRAIGPYVDPPPFSHFTSADRFDRERSLSIARALQRIITGIGLNTCEDWSRMDPKIRREAVRRYLLSRQRMEASAHTPGYPESSSGWNFPVDDYMVDSTIHNVDWYCRDPKGFLVRINPGGLAATVLTAPPALADANATLASLATAQTSIETQTTALAAEKKRTKLFMATTVAVGIAGIAAYALKPSRKR